ncbi:enolase-phosphatase E1-like isoform X2 [Mytilus edulis]|uniref:enolase-phosphatase E1-like isoform X1 n=1 Tax=Mytilus edulis TaxID=6550 RepID=UPI0039F04BC8
MNQEIKELTMDEDKEIFERNLSGFTLSILHAACSETETDAVSVQQTKDTETASEEEIEAFFGDVRTKELDRLTATQKEQNDEAGTTESASEEERAAFFGDVRTKEFERLAATMKEHSDEAGNTETASEEERISFFKDVRTKELDSMYATCNTQVDKTENQDLQAKPVIRTEEIIQNQVDTEALDSEETANEEDRVAFFQSVRDAERKKLVDAFEREKIWKEEREERRAKKRQEQIRRMFEEFHKPAVSPSSASYSPAQEPGPSNEQYHQYPSSSNAEYNIMLKASVSKLHERVKAFAEEQKDLQQKLEQSHATKPRADTDENKENRHISIRTRSDVEILLEDRTNDVKKTGSVRRFVSRMFKRSKSTTADFSSKQIDPEELKLDLSLLDDSKEKDCEEEDHPDTARTSNSEWYTLSDIEEPPRPRLKPFFTPLKETHETTRSKLSGSTNHKVAEAINQFLLNEPTKSDPTEIPVYSGSTGRFHRFRKWFGQLCCCCCSQNDEDRDTVCS